MLLARGSLSVLLMAAQPVACGHAQPTRPMTAPTSTMLYANDFTAGLDDFAVEAEQPGRVEAKDGVLTIDVPAGCTVWLERKLEGPIQIDYDAVVVSAGGANDRVSDLNCFWMATDPAARGGSPLARPRSGKFADYDTLKTYYVGYGGNANTTTRFRRYIGQRDNRPLLPEHDLKDKPFLITPNKAMHVRLIADGSRIEFHRDGERIFQMNDPSPYESGWFGFRTVTSHLEIRNLRVTRPSPAATSRPVPR